MCPHLVVGNIGRLFWVKYTEVNCPSGRTEEGMREGQCEDALGSAAVRPCGERRRVPVRWSYGPKIALHFYGRTLPIVMLCGLGSMACCGCRS